MERAFAVLLALCAVFAVGESIKCYKCTRAEWTVVNVGENDDKCEYPERDEPPTEDDCEMCAMDTRDEGFDWVSRSCIKAGETCTNGTFEEDVSGLQWVDEIPLLSNPKFDAERMCCDTDMCNGDNFDTDGATGVSVTISLVVAALVSAYYNLQ